MAIYTIHVPDDAPDVLTRGERTVFVREGISLRAFVFGLVYLLWHRLWIAAAVWIVLLAAVATLGVVVHPPLACLVALLGLMHLYLAVEGPDLLRWGLGQRGYTMRTLLSAPRLADAEALFFTRQPEAIRSPAASLTTSGRWIAPATLPSVIGFPDGDGA